MRSLVTISVYYMLGKRYISYTILFVQDLIVWLKKVDHSQLLPVNFGTA